MGHPLVDDVTFAVALAAWWQLRRSAYLLPHLRRGQSSFRPWPGIASWIIASAARVTRPRPTPADAESETEQATDVLEALPVAASPQTDTQELASTTMPIPVPSDLLPALPPPPLRPPRRTAYPPAVASTRAMSGPRPPMDAPARPSSAAGVGARHVEQRGRAHASTEPVTRVPTSPRGSA